MAGPDVDAPPPPSHAAEVAKLEARAAVLRDQLVKEVGRSQGDLEDRMGKVERQKGLADKGAADAAAAEARHLEQAREARAKAEALDAEADQALNEARGRDYEEIHENAEMQRVTAERLEGNATNAAAEAAEYTAQAEMLEAQRVALEQDWTDLNDRLAAANVAVDAVEDKAALLFEADALNLNAENADKRAAELRAEGDPWADEMSAQAGAMRRQARAAVTKADEIVVDEEALAAAGIIDAAAPPAVDAPDSGPVLVPDAGGDEPDPGPVLTPDAGGEASPDGSADDMLDQEAARLGQPASDPDATVAPSVPVRDVDPLGVENPDPGGVVDPQVENPDPGGVVDPTVENPDPGGVAPDGIEAPPPDDPPPPEFEPAPELVPVPEYEPEPPSADDDLPPEDQPPADTGDDMSGG